MSEMVTIQINTSLKGLETALMHKNKPIAYASKSLPGTEKCYACIEREFQAIVFKDPTPTSMDVSSAYSQITTLQKTTD